jgi:hypothetical protein
VFWGSFGAATGRLRYFLSLAQWLDAFDRPIEHYLDPIVTCTRNALKGQPLTLFLRPLWMRWWKVAAGAVAVVIVAILTSQLSGFRPPSGAMATPLTGRWKLDGGSCVLDVGSGNGSSGPFTFSDGCSGRLLAATGIITMTRDGTIAPAAFHRGDDGTFTLNIGGTSVITGSFRKSSGYLALFGSSLVLNADGVPAGTWRQISGAEPVPNDADSIVPAQVDWRVRNVPQRVQAATTYMRRKWQPDAVLVGFSAELERPEVPMAPNVRSSQGGVQVSFSYYSRKTALVAFFMPHSQGGALHTSQAGTNSDSSAIRGSLLDLPTALARIGNPSISKAVLEWDAGTSCSTGNIGDNAVLPPCGNRRRVLGVLWVVDTLQNGNQYIYSTVP